MTLRCTTLLGFSTTTSTISTCPLQLHFFYLTIWRSSNYALASLKDIVRWGILSNSENSAASTKFNSLAPYVTFKIPDAHPNRYFPFVFSTILQGSNDLSTLYRSICGIEISVPFSKFLFITLPLDRSRFRISFRTFSVFRSAVSPNFVCWVNGILHNL